MNSPHDQFPPLSVHVLGEYVFCPRAAILADESGDERDSEPELGPKLHDWLDYNAYRFAEELRQAWDALYFWLTMLAPALLLMFACWLLISPLVGPLFLCLRFM